LDTVLQLKEKHPEAVTQMEDFGENAMKIHDYNIRLINSDFKLGYFVNRRILDQKMSDYNLYHIFEAGHYPGVKISFYWNPLRQSHEQTGVCKCPNQECMRKTKGGITTPEECKKTTVIVFQSGSVIITGSQTIQQLDDTYKKMVSIFNEIKDDIKKTVVRSQECKKYPKFSYDLLNNKKMIRLPKGYKHEKVVTKQKTISPKKKDDAPSKE